ncbi:MAG TPA: prepilin-type N-terminal cleavage/methylation domain-containing protein [Chthoniobacterales bacterium]|nr:prepilin-type N-terminal cleavage/methylation domain-containing protein [Chthoniobacterales bacterium]
MPRSRAAFTLLEIIIAVAIMATVLFMAIPSFRGVLADRHLRASLDGFNKLVRAAQERSVSEHRSYLIVWTDKNVFVQPESLTKDDSQEPVDTFELARGEVLTLTLPAALTSKKPGEWIFWPTGTCEPAIVQFTGRAGTWTENYSPLTGHGDLTSYAAR